MHEHARLTSRAARPNVVGALNRVSLQRQGTLWQLVFRRCDFSAPQLQHPTACLPRVHGKFPHTTSKTVDDCWSGTAAERCMLMGAAHGANGANGFSDDSAAHSTLPVKGG